jgi:hypothetical protein
MVMKFAVGDHVRWNSEAGYVEGVIIKKHTHDLEFKGYVHHCTENDPQYEIRSDKTDHIAQGRSADEALERSSVSRVAFVLPEPYLEDPTMSSGLGTSDSATCLDEATG